MTDCLWSLLLEVTVLHVFDLKVSSISRLAKERLDAGGRSLVDTHTSTSRKNGLT